MSKPLVFISHIHEDSSIAMAFENLIKGSLLGGIEIFNTSNRSSLAPGEPWRDLIVHNLRGCVATLVVATPQSVTSPWVNFESGGAWISEKRVIPCCARGMRISSLPAPLSHLKALEIANPGDIRQLIEFLSNAAELQKPRHVDYALAAADLEKSWAGDARTAHDEEVIRWLTTAMLRPKKFRGEKIEGVFKVSDPHSVDYIESSQFRGERVEPGDSVRCRIEHPGVFGSYRNYSFINGNDVDRILDFDLPRDVKGILRCIGQIKVIEKDMVLFEDEDRGIAYHPAFVFENIQEL
jgi:hypothetical protein